MNYNAWIGEPSPNGGILAVSLQQTHNDPYRCSWYVSSQCIFKDKHSAEVYAHMCIKMFDQLYVFYYAGYFKYE